MGCWGRHSRWCLVLIILVASTGYRYGNAVAEIQSPLSSYTSPTFGYAIAWDSGWQIDDQRQDATSDTLSLVDGNSFVFFSGQNDGSDAQAAVDGFSGFLLADDSFVDTQPLAECPSGNRAIPSVTACFTYLRVYDTGDTVPEAALLEAWDLGDGVRLLMVATVAQELFAAYLPVWASFGITPAGQPVAGALPAFAELDGVTFSFDPGVTDSDRADVIEGIRLGQEVISRYLGLETLEEIQVSVRDTANAERQDAVASTLGFEIEVYAGGESWQYAPGLIRIETLVHELTHVYQNQLLGPADRGVPLWFDEGAAEAMGYLAITQIGVLDQAEIYELASFLLTNYPVAGGLEQFAPYGSLTTEAYPLSYIAVQYLLGRSGLSVSALGDFYRAIASGASVDSAFTRTFGIALAEYYVEFDAWSPGLLAEFDVPADFLPLSGTEQPAPAEWVRLPSQIERGDQLSVVVRSEPGAVCSLELQLGGSAIERDTFANNDGEAFWLVTIPEEAQAGPTTVTAACGGAPALATIDVR